MKKGSIILALAATIGLLMFMAPQVRGAAGWFYCTVDEAGTYSELGSRFMLSDTAAVPDFTDKYFYPKFATRQKEMLAVAMTAMSSGMYVLIYCANTTPWDAEVSKMMLVSELPP